MFFALLTMEFEAGLVKGYAGLISSHPFDCLCKMNVVAVGWRWFSLISYLVLSDWDRAYCNVNTGLNQDCPHTGWSLMEGRFVTKVHPAR